MCGVRCICLLFHPSVLIAFLRNIFFSPSFPPSFPPSLPLFFLPYSTVTKEEAGLIFDNFKFMKTTKAWKAFEANGNTNDQEAVRIFPPSPPCLPSSLPSSLLPVLIYVAVGSSLYTTSHPNSLPPSLPPSPPPRSPPP